MGTSLFGLKPKNTYQALLKTTANTAIDATLRTLSDGLGNDTPLQLSLRRVGVLTDTSVTTQTSAVIEATTVNSSLVLAPNGTGALIAQIPDGTATGGNARGTNSIDLQMIRNASSQVSNGQESGILSGGRNSNSGIRSVISGGFNNTISGEYANISGGNSNNNSTIFSTIGGGNTNAITNIFATASVISGGASNTISGGGGAINQTIGGGASNTTSSAYATVSGGQSNTASTGTHATVGGGFSNTASGSYSVVGGGNANLASGVRGVVVGGQNNSTTAGYTFIGGGNANTNNTDYGTVSGGVNNVITNIFATSSVIAGGNNNSVLGGGGDVNQTIGGGRSNTTSAPYATIGGGQSNTASTNTHATVVGGQSNTASGLKSVVGGNGNTTSAEASVSFGSGNIASARFSTALGLSSRAYLFNQLSVGSVGSSFGFNGGTSQYSFLVASSQGVLTTGGTSSVTLDGDGGNLIIPSGNNRAWNVQVNWVAVVTTITGTATGISVGDVITSIDLLAFKRVGGISSASTHTSTATKTMVTTPAQYAACAINYTAGASQEMALTFTAPTFVGGGSVTMRVVARVELAEVAW